MRYFETFAGVGGFALAIKKVFPNAKCVGFSEVDKFANIIYKKRFPGHFNYGDVKACAEFAELLPDFDCLVGGPPCTDLSIAKGNREGLKGSRSGLFYSFVEILRKKKPKYFIMENVASMSKEDRAEITRELETIYPKIYSHVMTSDCFTPQKRLRIYWTNFPFTKPTGTGERWSSLVAWSRSTRYDPDPENPGEFISRVEERETRDGRANTCTTGSGCGSFSSRNYWEGNGIRRALFPWECEVLQGFPIGWTEGVSMAQRYKQIGNAVTVPVVEHILKDLDALQNKNF